MSKIVRVLIVDDSAYVRKVVRQMLSRSPFIEVVGTARDGQEALEFIEKLEPDVVTLDLIMPCLDGVEFLREQMTRRPLPVVVVSIAGEAGEMALAALDAGAVDFVQKPTALATEKIFEIADELTEKVKAAAKVPMGQLPVKPGVLSPKAKPKAPLDLQPPKGLLGMVAIGISTGGPQALATLIPQLPANFPVPIAVVLHMPVGYTKMYAERLDQLSELKVVQAEPGDVLRPGMVFIAPGGRHLTFKRQASGKVVAHLDARPFDTLHRPSVDVMFQSAAEIYRDRLLGVVMTGMGSDGKQGASWIKSQGGLIFTEAESSCIVYGMPRAVVESNLSDRAVSLEFMARAILDAI
jgi:two-component system chemotaxis response regulator CheB